MLRIAINHIAVVVDDMEAALNFWQSGLGLALDHSQEVPEEEVRIAVLPIGESKIELVEPTTASSGIARYRDKRGPGIHHLCLEVADIEQAMAQLTANGAEMINETPRTRDNGTRYAFVHPKSAGGVLIELYEVAAASPEDGEK